MTRLHHISPTGSFLVNLWLSVIGIQMATSTIYISYIRSQPGFWWPYHARLAFFIIILLCATSSQMAKFHSYNKYPFSNTVFTLTLAWISNNHYQIWDEITYPIPNVNCAVSCNVIKHCVYSDKLAIMNGHQEWLMNASILQINEHFPI